MGARSPPATIFTLHTTCRQHGKLELSNCFDTSDYPVRARAQADERFKGFTLLVAAPFQSDHAFMVGLSDEEHCSTFGQRV